MNILEQAIITAGKELIDQHGWTLAGDGTFAVPKVDSVFVNTLMWKINPILDDLIEKATQMQREARLEIDPIVKAELYSEADGIKSAVYALRRIVL